MFSFTDRYSEYGVYSKWGSAERGLSFWKGWHQWTRNHEALEGDLFLETNKGERVFQELVERIFRNHMYLYSMYTVIQHYPLYNLVFPLVQICHIIYLPYTRTKENNKLYQGLNQTTIIIYILYKSQDCVMVTGSKIKSIC